MSKEEFLGRVVNPGFQSHYFDLCDVCEKRTPNWLETNQTNNVHEISLTCNDCHDEYLIQLNQPTEIDSEKEFEKYDEIPEDNEDITPVERPAWMQDFIDDAKEIGVIETIGDSEEAVSNLEILEDLKEDSDTEIISPEIDDPNQIPDDEIVLASWSALFIKEALFGQDPEKWLEEQQAFVEENVETTIVTLSKLSENQVTNVKITAIHCLSSVARRYTQLKPRVIDSLNNYIDDIDEMIVNYAQETINSIQ